MSLSNRIQQYLHSLHRAGVTHVPSPKVDDGMIAKLQQLQQQNATTEQNASQSALSNSGVQSENKPLSVKETGKSEENLQLDLVQESKPVFSGNKVDALNILRKEVAGCTLCSELASTRTQTVFGVGNPEARLLFLGEAPGADEDRQGEPFVGAAGQKLTEIIEKGMKLSRTDDVYIMNILKCRPPGNRNPTSDEADHCRAFLDRQLEIVQPEFICCLGAVAATNLLRSKLTIGKLRGKFHDYNGIQVIATYHPAYILRNPSARKQVWEDIQMLMTAMGLGH